MLCSFTALSKTQNDNENVTLSQKLIFLTLHLYLVFHGEFLKGIPLPPPPKKKNSNNYYYIKITFN